MRPRKTNSWLFAFTDLAFLLLISLSLIPSAPTDLSLRLATMDLPEVPDNRTLTSLTDTAEHWELRVWAVGTEHAKPFLLQRAGEEAGQALDSGTLLPALESLRQREAQPVLLPEKKSLSQDLLFAAAAMARVWSSRDHRLVVRPTPEGAVE